MKIPWHELSTLKGIFLIKKNNRSDSVKIFWGELMECWGETRST